MDAWQPIETAPKDGTKIVIWSERYSHCPIAWWGEEDGDEGAFFGWRLKDDHSPCGSCQDDFIGWNEDIEDGLMPTHWTTLAEKKD